MAEKIQKTPVVVNAVFHGDCKSIPPSQKFWELHFRLLPNQRILMYEVSVELLAVVKLFQLGKEVAVYI